MPQAYVLPLTALLILFHRKKEKAEQAIPVTAQPFVKKTVTEFDVKKAKEELKVLSLERDIVGTALTLIYDAENRGEIDQLERSRLASRHQTELKRIEVKIIDNQRIVDLYELESAKGDLVKSFYDKIAEIDARINKLRPAVAASPSPPEIRKEGINRIDEQSEKQTASEPSKTTKERPKSKAEEKMDAIREEVLKAMDRLEQIEAEG